MPQFESDTPVTDDQDQYLRTAGNPRLRETRQEFFAASVRQTQLVENEQKKVARKLDRELSDRLVLKRDGSGELTRASEKRVDVALRRAVEESHTAMVKRQESAVRRAALDTARKTSTELASLGLRPPSKRQMEKIAKEVAADDKPFFGLTTAERLGKIRGRTLDRTRAMVAQGTDTVAIRRQIRDSLSVGVGGVGTPGGSTVKEAQRLLVADTMRKGFEVDRRILVHSGVKFAYRRLNATHPRYNKLEICEFLNTRIFPGIEAQLRAAGIDPQKIDLRGLYPVDQMPDYPHAFCKCWLEPLPVTEDLALEGVVKKDPVDDAADGVGTPSEDAAGAANREANETYRALAQAISPAELSKQAPVTQALNGLAAQAGLEGVAFTTADIATLGLEGAAAVFAERATRQLGRDGREQLLAGVRRIMIEQVPVQQARLDDLRTERDRLVGKIQRDRERILSETTSTKQMELAHARFVREASKALANVRTLNTLEAALAGPRGQSFRTASVNSEAEMVRRMNTLGLTRDRDYTVVRSRGRFAADVATNDRLMERYDRLTRQSARVREIKDAIAPERTRRDMAKIDRRPGGTVDKLFGAFDFNLDRNSRDKQGRLDPKRKPPAQLAGMAMVEAQRKALWNFAPGLGKTPLAVSSISDLRAKDQIQTSIVSPPASIRQQFVVETLHFNEKDRVSFYVPSSDVRKSRDSIRSSLTADFENARSVGKKARSKGVDALSPSELEAYRALQEESAAYAQERMDRLTIVGVTGRTARKRFDDHMRSGGGDRDLFHIMGHDDLARVAPVVRDHIDYVAIDEVHQMTSASPEATTAKAKALPQLTGGRIKYKVGMSGTPVRNNLGEAWDVMNWLEPDRFPPKVEFQRQHSNVTFESDTFRESTLKLLRRETDDLVITMGSPVDADLKSAFSERISKRDRERQIRRLEMSDEQRERAQRIENQFDALRRRRDRAKADGKLPSLRAERAQKARDLDELVASSLGMGTAAYARAKAEALAEGRDPNTIASRRDKPPTQAERRRIAELDARVRDLTNVLSPASFRDNEHHRNLHGGDDWRKNAKAVETVRLLTTPQEEGGLQGRPTLIHLERFESIDMLEKALGEQGLRVASYHGGLGPSERTQRVAAMNEGQLDVLILTRAGSTGLNVQKASDATIHFDLPYTFAEVEQRDARNWRNGQQNEVESFTLLNDDMFTDRRRLELVQEKRGVLKAIGEIAKETDLVDPLSLERVASRPEMQSYDALVEQKGRAQADAFLADLCRELVSVGAATSSNCPVRPARLRTAALRNDPILGEVPRGDRATLAEES